MYQTLLNHIIPNYYLAIYPHQAIHVSAIYQYTPVDPMIQGSLALYKLFSELVRSF